jgi:hypothetical protein
MQELAIPLSKPAADSAGSNMLTSAGQSAESAAALGANRKVLTSAEAKALLFRVQLAEEKRQAELAKQKGGKGNGPILGGVPRKPRRPR